MLLERRESLKYVQEQLGHASAAITLTTYTHLIPRDGHRAVDGLDTPPGHARIRKPDASGHANPACD